MNRKKLYSYSAITWFLPLILFGQSLVVTDKNLNELKRLRILMGQRLLICVDWPKLSPEQETLIRNGWVGGVVLYDQDVKSPQQLKEYVKSLRRLSPSTLLVTVDQEGGDVRRLREEQGFQYIPQEESLGISQEPKTSLNFGVKLGHQLREAGIDLDFAPVVDLNPQKADSVITMYHRSLGTHPERVAFLAGQIIKGMKSQGVIAVAKHFPGESLESANPHDDVAVSTVSLEEMEKKDLVPYKKLIANGLQAVMTSHVVYTQIDADYPASLSRKIINDLLRREMGVQGVVICDDLQMGAVKKKYELEQSAVLAAAEEVDLIVATGDTGTIVLNALVKAFQDGRISQENARQSYNRISKLKAKRKLDGPK